MLLKAGAETDKRDVDGHLAIDLAPDAKVSNLISHGIERADQRHCRSRNLFFKAPSVKESILLDFLVEIFI